jgi:hypothetical protein
MINFCIDPEGVQNRGTPNNSQNKNPGYPYKKAFQMIDPG